MKKTVFLLVLGLVLSGGLFAQSALDSGLVAYYPFNANADDHSGNNNHGVVYGAQLTEDRFGNFNSAYSFDGIDDYINCGNDSSLYAHDMSITQWIKLGPDRTTPCVMVNDYSSASGEWGIYCTARTTNIIGSTAGAGANDKYLRADSPMPIDEDKWHFIGVVFSNSEKVLRLYIDGILSAENTSSRPEEGWDVTDELSHDPLNHPWLIGLVSGHLTNQNVGSGYFKGMIDDIRIYNRTLNDSEIEELYNITSDESHLILNGGFESNFEHWGAAWSVELSDEIKYEGEKSVLINTTTSGKGYIHQSFKTPTAVYKADFWIYPASDDYDQLIEFNADWPGSNVVFHNIIRFSPDNFSSRSYDSLIVLPGAMQAFKWNHLSIISDKSGDLKISLNGILYFMFNNPEPVPVESLVFGDLRTDANFGTVYYDNITVVDSIGMISSDNISVSILSHRAFTGDTLTIPIHVKFPIDSLFSSAELEIGGDWDGLDLLEVNLDSCLTGDAGWIYEMNKTDSNTTIWLAGAQKISGEGVLFNVIFAVSDTATGIIPVTINSAFFDTDKSNVFIESGSIRIFPTLYGDVDINGKIQAYDASLILKHLVGRVNLDTFQVANGDVSLDQSLSALDASLILQYGVGLLESLPYDTTNGEIIPTGTLAMADQDVYLGDEISIPIQINNGENIFSFEGHISFNPDHLVYNEIIWPELLENCFVEINSTVGIIKFAGASKESLTESAGIFCEVVFTVNQNLLADSTMVVFENLRLNESDPVIKVAETKLINKGVSDIKINSGQIPLSFQLAQNFPNPFNPSTLIKYQLPEVSYVELTVFNLGGKKVATLISEKQAPGYHSFKFDAKNLSSGIYFYRIEAGEFQDVKKMILIK